MHIAHIESSMNWGGQELRVIEQSRWLLDHGHKATVIARPGSAILAEAQKRQLPHFSLAIRGSAHPVTIYRLIRLLRAQKVDLLDAHSNRDASCAAFVKWLTPITVVRSCHVSDHIKTGPARSLIWRRGNHRITTTAQAVKDQIVAARLRQPQWVDVQIAGVDPGRFRPDLDGSDLRRQLRIPAGAPVIANIGMIRPDKGLRYLVEAIPAILATHPDCHFIQVGEATNSTLGYKREVEATIAASDFAGRFHFLGYHSDVENYIAIADIIAIASVHTEAQTRLVPQGMLMKKNLVVTDTGGLPEMVEQGHTGVIVARRNAAALAEGINTLLNDPELSQRLRDNAYSHALQHMTHDGMMRALLQSYAKAMAANRAHAHLNHPTQLTLTGDNSDAHPHRGGTSVAKAHPRP